LFGSAGFDNYLQALQAAVEALPLCAKGTEDMQLGKTSERAKNHAGFEVSLRPRGLVAVSRFDGPRTPSLGLWSFLFIFDPTILPVRPSVSRGW
jgi:hypothetical protein